MSLLYSEKSILSQLREGYRGIFDEDGETIVGMTASSSLSLVARSPHEGADADPADAHSVDESEVQTPTMASESLHLVPAMENVANEMSSLGSSSPKSPGSIRSTLSRASASLASSGEDRDHNKFFLGWSSGHSEEEDETETDIDLAESTLPAYSVTTRSTNPGDESLYDMNVDDDSDIEEDLFLMARQQMRSPAPTVSAPSRAAARALRRSTSGMRPKVSHQKLANVDRDKAAQREPVSPGRQRAASEPRPRSGSVFSVTKRALPDTDGPDQPRSLLTELIRDESVSKDDPLEQYRMTEATGGPNSMSLSMYMPQKSHPSVPFRIHIRKDCPVYMAIGYALWVYRDDGRLPSLPFENCYANKWNLRLAEEDGQPDDDFPPLERTRPIASYSAEEFALVLATDAETAENERATPNLFAQQARSSSRNSVSSVSGLRRTIMVQVFWTPYDSLLSKAYWQDIRPANTTVRDILVSVCQKNSLDRQSYLLRQPGATTDLDALTPLSNISVQAATNGDFKDGDFKSDGGQEPTVVFEIVPRRSLDAGKTARSKSPAQNGRQSGQALMPQMAGDLQSLGYFKYSVWRRQPMSFMGRHARDLTIDGEYIHILPPSDRTLADSPKTTSFHLRQVIKAKKSSKVSTYVKILVMKHNGPKRYDIETVVPSEATEIVERINRLRLR